MVLANQVLVQRNGASVLLVAKDRATSYCVDRVDCPCRKPDRLEISSEAAKELRDELLRLFPIP